MHLSVIAIDVALMKVIRDMENRDLLHKIIMLMFPDDVGEHPRKHFDILYRVERMRILLQSTMIPSGSRLPRGYRLMSTKDLSEAYSHLKVGMSLRFRIDANTSLRRPIEPQEWIPHLEEEGNTLTKIKTHRVGCRTYDERAKWLERAMDWAGAEVVSYAMESLPVIKIIRQEGDPPGILEATRFDGILKIQDLERFMKALQGGIGQGKPYGLALLSIA